MNLAHAIELNELLQNFYLIALDDVEAISKRFIECP
jgi:hypothetical protein